MGPQSVPKPLGRRECIFECKQSDLNLDTLKFHTPFRYAVHYKKKIGYKTSNLMLLTPMVASDIRREFTGQRVRASTLITKQYRARKEYQLLTARYRPALIKQLIKRHHGPDACPHAFTSSCLCVNKLMFTVHLFIPDCQLGLIIENEMYI